jgi:hypothetical protein
MFRSENQGIELVAVTGPHVAGQTAAPILVHFGM